MQNQLDNFFFGCARLQPKPMTSPATILPNNVSHYTIEAFGEKAEDFNTKLQWRSAKFYFEGSDAPLEILSPNLRGGYTDPCPSVCMPIFNNDGIIEFRRRENPYFSEANWKDGVNDLFNVIRLHHHIDGTNGQGKLLKSTSYCRKNGVSAQWHCHLEETRLDQLRQSLFDHICKNPQIFDGCINQLQKLGVYLDKKDISTSALHLSLADFDKGEKGSLKWIQRWSDIKKWWGEWQEDFFYDLLLLPEHEGHGFIEELECKFKDSFYGQLIVEETMPLMLRGLVWRIAQRGTPVV